MVQISWEGFASGALGLGPGTWPPSWALSSVSGSLGMVSLLWGLLRLVQCQRALPGHVLSCLWSVGHTVLSQAGLKSYLTGTDVPCEDGAALHTWHMGPSLRLLSPAGTWQAGRPQQRKSPRSALAGTVA